MFRDTKIFFFVIGFSSGSWSISTWKQVPVDQTNLETTFPKSLSDMYSCVGPLNDLMTNAQFFTIADMK